MSTTTRGQKRKAAAIADVVAESQEQKQKKQKLNPVAQEEPENAKMAENIPMDSEDNIIISDSIELPPEILVLIFSRLGCQDLSRASCVSQHWWLCSKDETLAWVSLSPIQLQEVLGPANPQLGKLVL